jgi:hypothetical protein
LFCFTGLHTHVGLINDVFMESNWNYAVAVIGKFVGVLWQLNL